MAMWYTHLSCTTDIETTPEREAKVCTTANVNIRDLIIICEMAANEAMISV